jgi:hypothetical protein
MVIQQLLAEIGVDNNVDLTAETGKQTSSHQTPETYLGYSRQESFVSKENLVRNENANYSIPQNIPLHHFAVSGDWIFGAEDAESNSIGSQLKIRFFAKDVYLVLDSQESASVSVEVLSPAKENLSDDIGQDGLVQVDEARLYHLVSFDEIQQGELVLTFNAPGIKAFAFTFGS